MLHTIINEWRNKISYFAEIIQERFECLFEQSALQLEIFCSSFGLMPISNREREIKRKLVAFCPVDNVVLVTPVAQRKQLCKILVCSGSIKLRRKRAILQNANKIGTQMNAQWTFDIAKCQWTFFCHSVQNDDINGNNQKNKRKKIWNNAVRSGWMESRTKKKRKVTAMSTYVVLNFSCQILIRRKNLHRKTQYLRHRLWTTVKNTNKNGCTNE